MRDNPPPNYEPPPDLAGALPDLPLFPLRPVVLFPGVLLPLHVFEPRYVTLVRDIIERHRTLSVVQVTDPDADLSGNPPIATIAGVGTIVEHVELGGNRFNIMVLGRGRVRLQELSFQPPYRRAFASPLVPTGTEVPPLELAAMQTAANNFAAMVRKRDSSFELRLPRDASPGVLADACTHNLVLDPRDRQTVLEMLDVRKRVRHVTEVLTIQRATLNSEPTVLN